MINTTITAYEIREYNYCTGHLETLGTFPSSVVSRPRVEWYAEMLYDHSTDHTVYVAEVMGETR